MTELMGWGEGGKVVEGEEVVDLELSICQLRSDSAEVILRTML